MTGHTKARLWAVAGLVPCILVATWVSGPSTPDAGALLILAALGWAWITAVLAEHAWQTPTVKWLERRNRDLEAQVTDLETAFRLPARRRAEEAVIDLRDRHRPTGSSDLRQRVEAARAQREAEPTDTEIKAAESAARSAFVDPGTRFRDAP